MKKFTALTAAGILLISGCASNSAGPVAATVAGEKITQAEVKFYQDNLRTMLDSKNGVTQGALQYAIDDRIVLELSDKLDMELSDEEEEQAKTMLINFRRSRGGMKAFETYVKETGITEDFTEDIFKAQILREKLMEESTADISDDEMKQYYKDNYYRAKHILIATSDAMTGEEYDEAKKAEAKTKADELMKRAQDGEDFDTLMNENSEDPGSKSQPDGYIFTNGEMVTEFEDAVKGAEIGQITMCESDFGYHIILRLALDETPEMLEEGFDDVKSMLEEKLAEEKFASRLREMAEENGIKISENDKNKEKIVEELTSATPYPTPAPSTGAM